MEIYPNRDSSKMYKHVDRTEVNDASEEPKKIQSPPSLMNSCRDRQIRFPNCETIAMPFQ